MTTYTIPEEVLGVPLWVPDSADYFDVETGAMPNGDPCLAVRGDLSTAYKAFMRAPTLSPRDIFINGDYGAGMEWSMSCWLKLSDLVSDGAGSVMLGCSTYTAASLFADVVNFQTPLLLGPYSTGNFQFYRLTRANAGLQNKIIGVINGSLADAWHYFQDYWFLFTVVTTNVFVSGTTYIIKQTVYLDTYTTHSGDDQVSGTSLSATPYGQPNYLHIGAYNLGGVGRGDLWRIGKWTFHDHALTRDERIAMWQAMYGPVVYTDNFNRASLGPNWRPITTRTNFSIDSNQAFSASGGDVIMEYARDLGSPNHYAEAEVVNDVSNILPAVRVSNFGGTAAGYYTGGYLPGTTLWVIRRGTTQIASVSSPIPSASYTVRLEAETNGGGNVDLRLYHNGALVLSFTDTDASRILINTNAGLQVQAGAGDARADNFECGTL